MLKVGNKIVLQIILTSLQHWRVTPNHQFRTYYFVLFIQAILWLLWCYLPWTRCWRWCESTIKLNLCCLKLLYFPLLCSNLFILWTDGTLLQWIKKLSRFFWSCKKLNLKLSTFPLFQTKNILWPRCKRSIICPVSIHPFFCPACHDTVFQHINEDSQCQWTSVAMSGKTYSHSWKQALFKVYHWVYETRQDRNGYEYFSETSGGKNSWRNDFQLVKNKIQKQDLRVFF